MFGVRQILGDLEQLLLLEPQFYFIKQSLLKLCEIVILVYLPNNSSQGSHEF